MKILKPENTPPKLMSEVHFARIRLAKAESQLATAKEQARLARRRRKEAKLVARRAKKQARLAKKELAEAKLALAQSEEKLVRLNHRPFRIKPQRKPSEKAAAAPPVKKPARTVAIRPRASVKRTKPAAEPPKGKPRVSQKGKEAARPITVPRNFETPGAIASTSAGKPTEQIVKGVEEIFNAGTQPDATPAPNFQQPSGGPSTKPSPSKSTINT